MFFADGAIVFGTTRPLTAEEHHEKVEKMERGEKIEATEWYFWKVVFDGSTSPDFITGDQYQHTLNFQDPLQLSKTRKSKAFKTLTYKNLYEGIDLLFEEKEGGLKYSFYVHPGADYKDIQMSYFGSNIKKTVDGGLSIEAEHFNSFSDQAPISYVANEKLNSSFELEGNTVSFELDPYDLDQELIIDPWLVEELSFEIKTMDTR